MSRLVIFLSLLVACTFIDFDHQILPDALTKPGQYSFGASGNGTRLVATNTTTLVGTSFNAIGGATLRLTGARRFIASDRGNVSVVARNPGSAVELPNVTEFAGATGRFQSLTVNAINGGGIQLGKSDRKKEEVAR